MSWVRYLAWQHTFVSPSAFSRRAVVSYWRKYVHEVLVNRLGGLSLPRKSVVRLTDRPDMTLDVYRGRKTTMQQQQPTPLPTLPLACPADAPPPPPSPPLTPHKKGKNKIENPGFGSFVFLLLSTTLLACPLQPPPPPPPTPKKKKKIWIWILCQNSLTRKLKIRVV